MGEGSVRKCRFCGEELGPHYPVHVDFHDRCARAEQRRLQAEVRNAGRRLQESVRRLW